MTDSACPEASWSTAQRVLFRFALLYFVLYALPFPFMNFLTLVNGVVVEVQRLLGGGGDGDAKGAAWLGEAMKGIAYYQKGWQAITGWLSEHGWVPFEVFHQRTGSGDTAHAYAKAGVSVVIAGVWTLVWTALARRATGGYPRLAKWLHLGTRWYVALVILGYGMIKFYSGQFRYPSLMRMMNPIGETSPMGLVWTFMGTSKAYEVFSGIGETLAALLLFSRRTSLLGVFVFVPVMANVVALNWLYDVPVKLFSTHLLVFGIALLVPDLPRLRALLANRPFGSVDLRLTKIRWLRITLVVFGSLWVGTHLLRTHVQHSRGLERTQQAVRPALYGIWEVEQMLRDGRHVSRTDRERWKLFAIEAGGRAWVRKWTEQTFWLSYAEDPAANTMSVARRRRGETSESAETWTFERSKVKRPGAHPAPRTSEDYRKTVDLERDALIVRGAWEGKPIELHLLRKDLPLERGFHLVQEMPFNR